MVTILRDATTCSLIKIYQRFRATYFFYLYFPTLKILAISPFEILLLKFSRLHGVAFQNTIIVITTCGTLQIFSRRVSVSSSAVSYVEVFPTFQCKHCSVHLPYQVERRRSECVSDVGSALTKKAGNVTRCWIELWLISRRGEKRDVAERGWGKRLGLMTNK
jgi:hypothetical protein